MPKLTPARLDGVYGMRAFTAAALHALADGLERDAADPACPDDPKWVLRWATRVRRLAEEKERSVEHRASRKRAHRTTQQAAAPDERPQAGARG